MPRGYKSLQMSEYKKTATSKKSTKSKGPALAATNSKGVAVASTTAVNILPCASTSNKMNKDSTVSVQNCVGSMPDSPQEYCQAMYEQALQAIFADCKFESLTPRKENELDVKMSLLMQRFSKTTSLLDNTCRRLKDISFVNELERLEDLKTNDCTKFLEQVSDIRNERKVFQRISNAEQSCLDQLETINVDFGYNKESGHKQLLDVVNETITGLEIIKNSSKIDLPECVEYKKSQSLLHQQEKDRLDFETLRAEYEEKFPKLTKEFLFDASVESGKIVEQSYDSDD